MGMSLMSLNVVEFLAYPSGGMKVGSLRTSHGCQVEASVVATVFLSLMVYRVDRDLYSYRDQHFAIK